jgi:putative nucleotidyltransferase with HDIG domain
MARIERIHLHVFAVCVVAFAVAVASGIHDPAWPLGPRDSSFWNALAALLILAVISESAFLKLPVGTATSTVVFIPYLASVVLLGPAWAMVIGAGTTLVAEAAIRRKPLIKILHNTAKEGIAVGGAGLVYVQLGGIPSVTALDLSMLAFLGAVGVYMLVSSGTTSIAVSLSSGKSLSEVWRRLVGDSLLFDFLASPIALLLALLYVKAELWGVIVVTVPLFLVRHVYSVNLQIEQVNRDLLELMVKAIEARDPYTSGHSLRVSRIAGALARAIALPAKHVAEIETAALLHDVGKIHQEYALLLRKAGALSPEEAALMRTHPIRSYELVRTISGFRGSVETAVRHHHENYDGSGYPDGLAAKAIPVGARIIMIADTADAMTTDRPYRTALSYDELVAELDRYSGSQFDPELVKAFKASAQVRRFFDDVRVEQEFGRAVPTQRVARLA